MEDKLHSLWATKILQKRYDNHQEIKENLLKFIEDYKLEFPKGRQGSENSNLYESNYDLFSYYDKNSYIKSLVNFIGDGFKQIAFHANQEAWSHNKIDPANISARITALWFIDYQKNGFVLPHVHSGSSWSMVYYLVHENQTSKGNHDGTYFMSPMNKSDSDDLGNLYSREASRSIVPDEGEGLFFPSTLIHSTYPQSNSNSKIIFSANCTFVNSENS